MCTKIYSYLQNDGEAEIEDKIYIFKKIFEFFFDRRLEKLFELYIAI